jgi:hypothetical protein
VSAEGWWCFCCGKRFAVKGEVPTVWREIASCANLTPNRVCANEHLLLGDTDSRRRRAKRSAALPTEERT